MKMKSLILAVLLCASCLTGCVVNQVATSAETTQASGTTTRLTTKRETSAGNGEQPTTTTTDATSGTTGSTATTAVTTTPETTAEATSTAAETTTTEATTTMATVTESSPEPEIYLYSSYAHMVSYDPVSGLADFDYFNMLKGDDAVQWLVNEEGYTLADAEAEVADYADSEFIEQNVNPQLRTFDLNDVALKLMYHSDGTLVSGAEPIDATISDLNALFAMDPDAVLSTHFYYVTVNAGAVETVSQVYWP